MATAQFDTFKTNVRTIRFIFGLPFYQYNRSLGYAF